MLSVRDNRKFALTDASSAAREKKLAAINPKEENNHAYKQSGKVVKKLRDVFLQADSQKA
jgi:hypothetical protein